MPTVRHVRKFLKRYTNLPAAIYVLARRHITLVDPETWDDSNDSHYLRLYRDSMGLKSVLALCFTQASETYHHWRVFSSGPSGVCIEFHRDALIKALEGYDVRFSDVRYRTLKAMHHKRPSIDQLPFIKRQAFRDDHEFRIVSTSVDKRRSTLDLRIPLSCINRITLSPWLLKRVADEVKWDLRAIHGCDHLSITRSTLVDNEEWKEIGDQVA
jgi:hypothetical protein